MIPFILQTGENMLTQFSRSELLLGPDSTEFFKTTMVAVFGLGGVGSFVVESLARSGIGSFVLFDADIVCLSNLNRQLIATHKTLGRPKVEAMKERILDINPNAEVVIHQVFYDASRAGSYDFSRYDYIVDCIDTISAKLVIIDEAKRKKIPIISCMGTGNKLDPTRLELADIHKTSVCPLARVMRQEIKKRRIKKLKVLYSREVPIIPGPGEEVRGGPDTAFPRPVPGSVSFVPSVAGLIIAGEVVKDLLSARVSK